MKNLIILTTLILILFAYAEDVSAHVQLLVPEIGMLYKGMLRDDFTVKLILFQCSVILILFSLFCYMLWSYMSQARLLKQQAHKRNGKFLASGILRTDLFLKMKFTHEDIPIYAIVHLNLALYRKGIFKTVINLSLCSHEGVDIEIHRRSLLSHPLGLSGQHVILTGDSLWDASFVIIGRISDLTEFQSIELGVVSKKRAISDIITPDIRRYLMRNQDDKTNISISSKKVAIIKNGAPKTEAEYDNLFKTATTLCSNFKDNRMFKKCIL